ncbi:MFS transporter [Dokdonella fugitiva]|jgi:SHS family lactate transporter-like MFS transporter|uniref:SHS family lactate transporter-like MFS transporter n=1 Tax=Dokdonella fugitiva TaxID=328517 RepID=A0A4R2I6W6_9GAMM|nr:MFS transporter [Dokdonella fugitiva]TCO40043.1 SHS family lactate transporter-like MFS transporter [Dokdonella fugitiva]
MNFLAVLRELDARQRKVVLASFLGWTLDAFDYFLLVFVIPEVAREFQVGKTEVAFSLMLTLAMRPLGAWLFGRLADRYGRRPVLMVDIVLFAVLEAASAFAPSLAALLVIRALFGIAMGGEWGIGASLAMESIPPKARGAVSGLLQEGYACGYLLGGLVYLLLFDHIGWRGMFVVGALPALLVLYIRRHVPESPVWTAAGGASAAARPGFIATMRGRWGLFAYLVVLMMCFNLFSHGSQDLYPTFLKEQHHFDTQTVAWLTITLNLGAIVGGLFFGSWSEQVGRRRAIVTAALLALPAVPLWAFGGSVILLGVGVFLLQVMVQGAWGVVPVHLNELSPDAVRATLPGFAYQGGNLLASATAPFLNWFADQRGGDYGFAMASFIAVVAVLLALVTAFGPEAHGARFAARAPAAE